MSFYYLYTLTVQSWLLLQYTEHRAVIALQIEQPASEGRQAVVLVPGLLGWGPTEMETPHGRVAYWDTGVAEDTDKSGLTILQASLGPVSSQHDRACELFAQLLGRRTDFGAEHSAEFGHEQFGTDFSQQPGLWPDWGPDRPCHFVGHSAGGNTIRMLHHLLATDFWGLETTAAWIKSVTCIASPLNGSTATYLYGCSRETGLFQWPSLVPLVSCVELIETLQGVPRENRGRLRHWRLEHWGLENEDFRSYSNLNSKLRGVSHNFLAGKDNLAYDLSLEGSLELNKKIGDDQPACYYLSILTKCTRHFSFGGRSADASSDVDEPIESLEPSWESAADHSAAADTGRSNAPRRSGFVRPTSHCSAFLLLPCAFMCAELVEHRLPGSNTIDWRHNDGLVPLASQRAPLVGGSARRPIPIRIDPGSRVCELRLLVPGRWHCLWANGLAGDFDTDWDHGDPVFGRSLVWEPPRQRWSITAAVLDGAAALARWTGLRMADSDGESFAKVKRSKQRQFYERLYRLISHIQ